MMDRFINRVIHGDCLEFMGEIPSRSIDCVVTDPPYSINTKSDGMGKINPWGDICNAAFWYSAWFSQVRRILKPSGSFWTFLSWRTLATFQKSSCDISWPIESLLVWDKEWIGPGGSRGLRPSYELVALFCMPDFSVEDRGLYDIQRFKWSGFKPNGHPAEKPVLLCKWLIENGCLSGDLILDPFCGSGTTLVAAKMLGRRYIGIDIEKKYCEIAEERLRNATPPLPFVTEKTEQGSLL